MLVKYNGSNYEIVDGDRRLTLETNDWLMIDDRGEWVAFSLPEWLATAIRDAFEKEINDNMDRGA